MDDFSNHPKSLTEIRGEKSGNGSQWTPRDALISVLRDIDSGALDVSGVIVAYFDEKTDTAFYSQSTKDRYTALGLLECAKFRLMES